MVTTLSISPYDHLPIGVYTCDEKGFLTSCNGSAIALWGRNPNLGTEQWSGAWKIFDDGDRLLPVEEYPVSIVVREKKVIPNAEYIIERPDGERRNVLLSSVPTFDEIGKFTGTINTLLDITEQKASEVRQAMLVSIIESSDDAIISKSLDGIILSWNQAAETMFGYPEHEALGKHISLIIPYEKFEEEAFIMDRIRRGETVEHFETLRMRRDGTQLPISLTISPIRNSKGVVVGASKIARDITRQKSADDQLKNYASQLEEQVQERTQMLEETIVTLEETQENLNEALANEKHLGQMKSRFVSMASHEFRTPLSTIKLSSSLVEKYAETSDIANINKHVNKIKNAVSNLTNILNDFLSLEKLEAGKVNLDMSEFDLMKFSEEIRDEMQMVAKPGQQIVYQHTGITASAILDRNLLHNCVINLLSNAIKYSPEDSIIELDTEVTPGEYVVAVSDHGIGIPADDQIHLFEAFFRANNTGGIPGTGLGLNIVARYTSLMKGKIAFKSEVGKGTRFTLTFPAFK
ncbi:MAG TPA: PAS domain-containing sensor histidine kinase [Mucilaginibacter sp.]|nr:PAS domain-containing sensor histidine kinase [Mucilaginibacter sp.]